MLGEICEELRRILFWSLVSVPITSPLSSRTSLFFDALYWAKSYSAGRSWETAAIIPKTIETTARTPSPSRTKRIRSFFSRGREFLGGEGGPGAVAEMGGGGGGGVSPPLLRRLSPRTAIE